MLQSMGSQRIGHNLVTEQQSQIVVKHNWKHRGIWPTKFDTCFKAELIKIVILFLD